MQQWLEFGVITRSNLFVHWLYGSPNQVTHGWGPPCSVLFFFLLYCSIFMPSIWRRGKEIYCPFAYDLDGLWQCSRLVCDQSRKKYAYLHFLFWAQLFFIIRQMDYWLICGWLVYCCSGAFCGALEGVRWQSFGMHDFAWRMEYGDQPDRLNE